MKFTIVAVLLSLALGANCSILGPVVVGGHWPGAVVVGPGPVQVVSGPVPAVIAAPAVVAAPSGTFVAKTRGAVHVAPLEGHLQSVVSANLQPAPGTI